MEENCWPSLQNSVVQQNSIASQPEYEQQTEECKEIVSDIIQLSENESESILKMYNIKSVDEDFCLTVLAHLDIDDIPDVIHEACASKEFIGADRPKLALRCIGTAMTSQASHDKIFFYSQEFPDGDVFIGYQLFWGDVFND